MIPEGINKPYIQHLLTALNAGHLYNETLLNKEKKKEL